MHETSHPGTSLIPRRPAASAARLIPAKLSWSVNATAEHPAAAANSQILPGASEPSETVEWVWRSITGPEITGGVRPLPGRVSSGRG